VRSGEPAEQKRVVESVFERVEFSVQTGELARVEAQPWVKAVLPDVAACTAIRAWRDSNPRPTA
jgi:hypothetical protein